MKMPTTIGATIDLLFKLREQRKEIEAKAAAVKDQEAALESHLMNNFDKSGLDGAKGKLATASITYSDVANVTDWDAVYKHIVKTKSFDLLQKRISVTACRERWADKKVVPGVEINTISTLRLTKAK